MRSTGEILEDILNELRMIRAAQPKSFEQAKMDAIQKIRDFTCPLCDGPMMARARKGTTEFFAGCERFPKCVGTRTLDGGTKQVKPLSRSSHNAPDSDYEPEDVPF